MSTVKTTFADEKPVHDTEAFRDRIGTIREDGKRKWVYPKKPSGRFYKSREFVAVALLALLFSGPFIKMNGQPILLLNLLERKFIFFGMAFWPADFHLVVLAALSLVVFVILFTAVFGRVWCGWACPQTIFMEMVFRKIEYWIEGDFTAQMKLDAAPWTAEKVLKKGTKHAIFFGLSFIIANWFLMYVIGKDALWDIVTDPPKEHLAGLTAITIFSGVFYGVFARFREQVCHFACPYGRFQSVLVDPFTLAVSYDFKRGEPRGVGKPEKRRREKPAAISTNAVVAVEPMPVAAVATDFDVIAVAKNGGSMPSSSEKFGDCIDCKQCVKVCPAGIDIRNGIQLECIQCTACIDACDDVMDKIGKPRGLVRYSSFEAINSGRKFRFNGRMAFYSTVLTLLLALFFTLLAMRSPTESILLRAPGTMFQTLPDGSYSNIYTAKIINKTFDLMPLDIRVIEPANGVIMPINKLDHIEPQTVLEGRFIVKLPEEAVKGNRTDIIFGVFVNGEQVETVKSTFIGPDSK